MVQRWFERARGQRLARVDWSERTSRPHRNSRTAPEIEAAVLACRRRLAEQSVLGDCGAVFIHEALRVEGHASVPAVRTIGRILVRCGALDDRRRLRRPAPPRGWYLPAVAAGLAELDSFDVITGLRLQNGPQIEVFTGLSLHGAQPGAWPTTSISGRLASEFLLAYWHELGLPAYAQFDNDTRFQGGHNHPDVFGRVMRLCLSLGVCLVFTPPRETGFQAAIENFNGRWQTRVWSRFHHPDLATLQERSAAFITASRQRAVLRRDAAPARPPLPEPWHFDLRAPLRGRLIFLRRTDEDGGVYLLGRHFCAEPLWHHGLVRCEVDLDQHHIQFYGLRRRTPTDQPLLRTINYQLPSRPYRG